MSARLVLLISTILFAFTASAAGPAVAPNEVSQLPPKENFHLYLLIGQSNMAGRGVLDKEHPFPDDRVLKFSKENTWVPATEPLHFDKPAIAGAGIGASFAREIADSNPNATIGLIPCAVGDTPLSRWQKGGDLYAQALVRAKAAMEKGTLKGILWHQGEGDSASEDTARSYGTRLAQMVKDLRADLDAGETPFVAGKLGEFLAPRSKDGKRSYWPLVNEQITSLPSQVPHTTVAESTNLQHKGDGVHFDTPSLREFGKRYAEAMKKLSRP